MSLQETNAPEPVELRESNPRAPSPQNKVEVLIRYCLSSDAEITKSDPLFASGVMSTHASHLGREVGCAVPGVKTYGTCVRPMGAGYETTITFESEDATEPSLGLTFSALHEAVLAALNDHVNAAILLAVSDAVAQDVALGIVVGRPDVKPAKSSQKELVKRDATGTLWVTVLHPQTLIKKSHKTLSLSAAVNAGGHTISLHLDKTVLTLTHLRVGATKSEWIVVQEQPWTSRCSGFFEQHRTTELWHGEKVHILNVPPGDAGWYAEASKTGRWVELTVEISRPSNPFLPDEPKFRILDTHGLAEARGQLPLS